MHQKINTLVFEPPFKHFTDALLNVIDFIIEAVMTVPRLECRLYLDAGQDIYLKVGKTEFKKKCPKSSVIYNNKHIFMVI